MGIFSESTPSSTYKVMYVCMYVCMYVSVSALDTEEEGGEDGSLRGVCLPGGVVLSNSPGLRSFERPSLPQASRLLQSSRQEGLPFCH